MELSSRRVASDASSMPGTGSQMAIESISCGIRGDYSLQHRACQTKIPILRLRSGPAFSGKERERNRAASQYAIISFAPAGAWSLISKLPTACAVGCTLPPLRGFLCRMGDAFGFFAGDYVEAHQVGGTGGLAGAGDDSEDVGGLEQAAANQILFGHGDHLFGGVGLAAAYGMDSPVKIHA